MLVPYESGGRSRQKARTRAAMVAATRSLLAEGVMNPTVEQLADRAEISRTTAYRYFPNQQALLAATYPNLVAPSLLDENAPEDVLERLDLVTRSVAQSVLEHEPELRTMLRLSLEGHKGTLPFRQGRVIRWIQDALSPLRGRLPASELRRLALAIRATIGIEPLVWLTDIGRLSRTEACTMMRSSARAVLRCALTDAGL